MEEKDSDHLWYLRERTANVHTSQEHWSSSSGNFTARTCTEPSSASSLFWMMTGHTVLTCKWNFHILAQKGLKGEWHASINEQKKTKPRAKCQNMEQVQCIQWCNSSGWMVWRHKHSRYHTEVIYEHEINYYHHYWPIIHTQCNQIPFAGNLQRILRNQSLTAFARHRYYTCSKFLNLNDAIYQ